MKITLTFIALLFVSTISGCTIMDGNAIVTGNIRPVISVTEVRLYRTAPKKYEEIAIVSSSAGHDFKQSSTLMNEAIQRLKLEAAKVGANGIILTTINERDAPSTTTAFGTVAVAGSNGSANAVGNSISVNRGDAYTRLSGVAIYVTE